jgi:hypothetical protein
MLYLSARSQLQWKVQIMLLKLGPNDWLVKPRRLSKSREILFGLSLMLIPAVKQREGQLLLVCYTWYARLDLLRAA